MAILKKAVSLDGLEKGTLDFMAQTTSTSSPVNKGIAGDKLIEPIPDFLRTDSEVVYNNENNAFIVLGRDRPGNRLSGYGGKGDTHAASIDLVAGRLGYEARRVDDKGKLLVVDPNFKKDAARIYISQKTDIDKNFELVPGKVGISSTKSGIALKADGIRIIAREGIKLITKTDSKNSQGGDIETILGIDLIAGNDDKDLQPLVKGNNLLKAFKRLVEHVENLSGIVDSFLLAQMEMNFATTHHFHYSPFFAVPTTPAIDVLVPKGVSTQNLLLSKVKKSLIAFRANMVTFKVTYLNPVGKRYINSRFNNTN